MNPDERREALERFLTKMKDTLSRAEGLGVFGWYLLKTDADGYEVVTDCLGGGVAQVAALTTLLLEKLPKESEDDPYLASLVEALKTLEAESARALLDVITKRDENGEKGRP